MMGCFTVAFMGWFSTAHVTARDRVPVIFDTDMTGDVDDVGALATLHALEDRGEADILAVGVSDQNAWTPLCVDAINTYYGHPEIPIGTTKGTGPHRGSAYTEAIAKEFPRSRSWSSADDVPDVVDVYREVLSQQPDNSVVLVSIGYLTNVSNLLASEPDHHSDFNGVNLVREKVRLWVAMAGGFPDGNEFNAKKDPDASVHATENWPKPVRFSGYEIGFEIYTGSGLEELPDSNPIRRAYELYNGLSDRHSWDQAAVLYTVRGIDGGPASDYWNFSNPGWIDVRSDGSNGWINNPDGLHRYKIEKRDPYLIADEIEGLMKQLPEYADSNQFPVVDAGPDQHVTDSDGDGTETVTLDGSGATDLDGTIESYSWAENGKKVATGISPSATLPVGSHTITLTVTDDAGAKSLDRVTIEVQGDPGDHLMLHLPMEEGTGTTVSDVSGNGHDATLNNTDDSNWIEDTGTSGSSFALSFGGSDEWGDVQASSDFSLRSMTLSSRVRFDSVSGGWKAILEHNRNGANWYGLYKQTGKPRVHFRWGPSETIRKWIITANGRS